MHISIFYDMRPSRGIALMGARKTGSRSDVIAHVTYITSFYGWKVALLALRYHYSSLGNHLWASRKLGLRLIKGVTQSDVIRPNALSLRLGPITRRVTYLLI